MADGGRGNIERTYNAWESTIHIWIDVIKSKAMTSLTGEYLCGTSKKSLFLDKRGFERTTLGQSWAVIGAKIGVKNYGTITRSHVPGMVW
jgi:hypothetical protein